jgi:hypothetical protein
MKSFFIVLLTSLFFQNSFSQDNRVPSQKQMQAQMKQAKTEAQQQIADMENEIAEAKKKGDDPESIQQMEKNLATLKKMLGVIDNVANVSQNKRPETISTTNTVAPYKSPYIKFYSQPVTTPTEAQAKDRLLWYKGKKINQNTLITTKGRVIRYDRQNNQVLVQYNEKKDTNTLKIINKLKKSRQWTNNYVNKEAARKNSFFDYPLVMMTMREFDLIEQEFNKLADNTIPLPGTAGNLMTAFVSPFFDQSIVGGPNPMNETNSTDSFDPWLKQAHQELLQLMNNPPPLDFPVPPKHEFDLCYYCDTSLQGKYDRAKAKWADKFDEYETTLISRCLGIERQFQLLIPTGAEVDYSEEPGLKEDMDKAMALGFKRMEQKVDLLEQRYGHDVYRQEIVVSSILNLARQRALLGKDIDESKALAAQLEVIDLIKAKDFEQFIDQRFQANDYNVVFNYSILFGHERIKQLLGVSNEGTEWDWIDKVEKLNHFALTLNIDFDIQYETEADKPILKANGHLSTAQKIYVRLGRTNNCKWQLYLYDPDYGSSVFSKQEMLFKIPLQVNTGIKQVLKNQTWVTYPYSGPTDLEMNFPIFKISFCPNSGSDSAMMDVIRYKQEDTYGDAANAYTTDLLAYLDKVLVSISDTKANQDEVIDLAGQMGTLSNQGTVDNPTGYAKLDEMQVKYKMNGVQHDLQKKGSEATKVGNTVILFDAHNGDQFLINGKTDTAHRELYVLKLNSGLIQLKVVLEPL